LAGEAQYFRQRPHWSLLTDRSYRRLLTQIGDISTENGAKNVVDFLFSEQEELSRFWNFSQKNWNRREFLCRFLETDRSERALLDLVLTFYAKGKPIRGEKTPANIYFVPTLLEWFPDAKIIQTFRDPRAIYISRQNKKELKALPWMNKLVRKSGLIFELYAGFRVVVDWQRSIQFHRKYKDSYHDSYYLSKYEDLICDPDITLRNLCNFLEVDFVEEMLHPMVVNSSFFPKDRSQKGFDTTAINRWRKYIHPVINNFITGSCRKQLLEYGYQL
jgi:hypothetical protein